MSDVWKELVMNCRSGSSDRSSVTFWLQGMKVVILKRESISVLTWIDGRLLEGFW